MSEAKLIDQFIDTLHHDINAAPPFMQIVLCGWLMDSTSSESWCAETGLPPPVSRFSPFAPILLETLTTAK
jgi:hypothetical protein